MRAAIFRSYVATNGAGGLSCSDCWCMRALLAIIFAARILAQSPPAPEVASKTGRKPNIHFFDAGTGGRINPTIVTITVNGVDIGPATTSLRDVTGQVRSVLDRSKGDVQLQVSAPGFARAVIQCPAKDCVEKPLSVFMQPIQPPKQFQSAFVDRIRRANAMVVLGFVVDDDTGEPLSEAAVSVSLNAESSRTNSDGFFLLHIPIIRNTVGTNMQLTNLVFSQTGYQTEIRTGIEVWPNGDWQFRMRLHKGNGTAPLDSDPGGIRPANGGAAGDERTAVIPSGMQHGADSDFIRPGDWRLPQYIRVLYKNEVQVRDLEEYTKIVLPSEWYGSWGPLNEDRGMHALRAGAVAIRTYAVGYFERPFDPSFDICGTPTCQAFNPERRSSSSDRAVDDTNGVLLTDSHGQVLYKSSEFSAENNSVDCSGAFCERDGFTGKKVFDPVCKGAVRRGHGRGMCQLGSIRWATGWEMAGGALDVSGVPHRYGTKDWREILHHYYPELQLARGRVLMIGDQVTANTTVIIRECAGGGIDRGLDCPEKNTRPRGESGVLIGGPVLIISDGLKQTWWKVEWSQDGVSGWSVENQLGAISDIQPSIVTGFSFNPNAIVPGALITIVGENLGPSGTTFDPNGCNDLVLGGTRVLFNGVPGAVVYASPRQINAIVPSDIPLTPATVEIEANGVHTDLGRWEVRPVGPEIATLPGTAALIATVLNEDGTQNSRSNPSLTGSIITLFGMGMGLKPVSQISLIIDGREAEILSIAPQPSCNAIVSIKARIPDGVSSHPAIPVVLASSAVMSQPGVTLSIQRR